MWTRASALKNSPVGSHLPPYVEKKQTRLTNSAGVRFNFDGVFATVAIPENAFVAVYRGRKITWQQANSVAGTDSGTYVFNYTDPATGVVLHAVDAADSRLSSWARLVNSPLTPDEQNLTWNFYKGHIYYKTTRNIAAGEELLLYYGDDTHSIISHATFQIVDWDAVDAEEAAAAAAAMAAGRSRKTRKLSISGGHARKLSGRKSRSRSRSRSKSKTIKQTKQTRQKRTSRGRS